MPSPLFLQAVSGDADHLGMASDHKERHLAYCKKWGYEYELVVDLALAEGPWRRIEIILDRLKSGKFSHVFCMDSDVFMADFSRDLRETLPDWAYYAATIHPYPWREQMVFHVQCGGFYLRSCDRSILFLENVLLHRDAFQDDQGAVNFLLIRAPHLNCQNGFNILPCEWNQTIQDCDFRFHPPIVAAFHGTPDSKGNCGSAFRRSLMKEAAKWYPYEQSSIKEAH